MTSSETVAGHTGRVTLDDVASAAGVSRTAVSFALNGRPGVSSSTRADILAVADRLGYRPDPLARELRTGSSSVVGFCVRNIANPFFNDVLSGMQSAAFEDGVTVVAMDSEYSEERERQHIEMLLHRRVAALAIAPVGRAAALEDWRSGRSQGRRTVLVNSSVLTEDHAPRVSPDSASAVGQALDHLHALGHRRIAILTAPSGRRSDEDRLDAARAWSLRHDVEPSRLEADLHGDDVRRQTGLALGSSQPPTAVVTSSDHSAHFVYAAARDARLVVGRDLSVVGHDDLPTSALLDPPLTTLAVDRRRLGHEVYRRLSGAAEGDLALPVRLVERASTGPVTGPIPSAR